MDESSEGLLVAATSMVLLICFALAVLAVMLIYRKRRLQHKTEVRAMEQRFERELLRSQLEVQNQTMQHIGREIHDNIGSQLTLAYLYTHQLPAEQPGNEGQGALGESIGQIIDQALTDLRALSKSLIQGQANQQTSLVALLSQECQKLNAIHFCKVVFKGNAPDKPGPLATNSFVLRIVQEFAQNSLKHAQCSTITISLHQHAKGLCLQANDDGHGFDPARVPAGQGIGLLNMQQRAQIIGAHYHLHSAPGQGTQMQVVIPHSALTQ